VGIMTDSAMSSPNTAERGLRQRFLDAAQAAAALTFTPAQSLANLGGDPGFLGTFSGDEFAGEVGLTREALSAPLQQILPPPIPNGSHAQVIGTLLGTNFEADSAFFEDRELFEGILFGANETVAPQAADRLPPAATLPPATSDAPVAPTVTFEVSSATPAVAVARPAVAVTQPPSAEDAILDSR
jgi:hypothetical protein